MANRLGFLCVPVLVNHGISSLLFATSKVCGRVRSLTPFMFLFWVENHSLLASYFRDVLRVVTHVAIWVAASFLLLCVCVLFQLIYMPYTCMSPLFRC